MSMRRLAPVLVALTLGAVACSSAPSVTTTTSTSSPTTQPGAAASPSPGAFRRGGLAGTVTSFDGSTLVLATRQGATVKVLTSGSTAVTKSVTATVGDIAPSDTVIVTGPQNPDGSYAATAIVDGTLGTGAGFGGNRTGTPSPRPSGGFGGGGFGGGGFGGGGRRLGTAGTVAAINGATLTLTTAAGTTITVDTSSATVVTRTAQGTLSDVAPNVAVTVTGPQNPDGSYSATRITIGGPFGGGAAQPSQAAA